MESSRQQISLALHRELDLTSSIGGLHLTVGSQIFFQVSRALNCSAWARLAAGGVRVRQQVVAQTREDVDGIG